MADVSLRSLPSGGGVAQATATRSRRAGRTPLLAAHYTEDEHLVCGSATTYAGPASGPVIEASSANPYVTRILVRHPSDPARFSGRVVLEPFNTSHGADVDPIWSRVGELLEASGDAWVGVSQRTSSQRTLQERDPVRYAAVSLPSNDLAWDILSQVGALVRDPTSGPLRDLRVERVYLAGYSQSGAETATFAMAFHDRTHTAGGAPVFDGYFPAAHSGSVTAIQSGRVTLPPFESVAMTPIAVPVIDIETQTDVAGFRVQLTDGRVYTSPGGASVRRSDSDRPDDRFRLYEVAGAPHAANVSGCDGEPSTFPTDAFIRAALVHLFRWAEAAKLPPVAPRLVLSNLEVVSAVAVDEVGNAIGGVRSPFVDVPLARYHAHSTPGPRCALAGRLAMLPATELAARYLDVDRYMDAFARRLDATIAAGFVLESDRSKLVALQQAQARRAFAPGRAEG